MKSCGECAYKALQDGKCPVFNREMPVEAPGCPLFSTTITRCALCGSIIMGQSVIDYDEDDNTHIICRNCLSATPCETCTRANVGYFQTDHTCQEPPFIMREVRQGNMIMQTQTLNPKRVEATCRQGCPCFNEEGLDDGTFCKRQSMCGCEKHRINWRN